MKSQAFLFLIVCLLQTSLSLRFLEDPDPGEVQGEVKEANSWENREGNIKLR